MVNVAVAGGLGGVGRPITETLVKNPKHTVIVLSRAAFTESVDFPVHVVDYNDIDSLVNILQSNNIHTVISAIRVTGHDVGLAEINLVKASEKSNVTKRFVSSDYGGMWPEPQDRVPWIDARLATVDALRSTDLEFTTFHNGPMMDFFGQPGVKTYIKPTTLWFDLKHRIATIPGTGDDLISFTYSFDVAKFVVAALDLPRWEEESFVYGDRLTFNEILRLYESKGVKWTVTYDDLEKLERNEVTELPSHALAYRYRPKLVVQSTLARYSIWAIKGLCNIPEEKSLNRMFPDIKTTSVQDVIEAWLRTTQN